MIDSLEVLILLNILMGRSECEAQGRYPEVGLKKSWSKDTSQWTKPDRDPTALDERARDREVLNYQ